MELYLETAHEKLMTDLNEVKEAMQNATKGFIFTLKNPNNGNRITYKVYKGKSSWKGQKVSFFVGTDNTSDSDYKNLGSIYSNFKNWIKSKYLDPSDKADAAEKGWNWLFEVVNNGDEKKFQKMEVWHSGTCLCCGALLTDPESIEARMGPICRMK